MPTKSELSSNYYMGDPNLPNVKAEFEYTPEMVSEIKKCNKSIVHFASSYFYIVSLETGKQKINLYKPQKRIIKSLAKNRFVIVLASRQIGKSTVMTIYALWQACFESDKRILIIANKESTAIMLLRRIRTAYEQLPVWLKPGVKQWGKTEIIFGNDSSIAISTTTGSAARGESANVLIVDEMAFVPDHLMKEFWNSVIPIVSSYKGTKIFCVSTPNGAGNMFHKIYSGSERGEKEFKLWKHERVDWWEIPGRGKLWKQDIMAALAGEGKSFDQEFGNVFLETGQSAIDAELLLKFREEARAPQFVLEDGAYKIWEEPSEDHLYVIGVDVSEGVGQASSVVQILDVTDLADIKQVGTYCNNEIDPFHFATKLNMIGNQWGRPQMLIERNNCGGQVIDALKEIHFYPYIVDYTPEKQKYYDKLGVYSHTNSKYKGVMNMRYWVNSLMAVTIYDIALVQELETFVKYPNGTWKKKQGDYIYDDRVMSLIWALFGLETDIAERYFDIVSYDTQGKPANIQAINVEAPEYFKLDPFYQNEGNAALPMFFGTNPDDGGDDDIQTLYQQGWRTPDEF